MLQGELSIAISNKKVPSCYLKQEIRGRQRIVPGIIYQNCYYVRVDSYSLDEYTQAQWKHHLLKRQKIENLIINEKTKYSIWAVKPNLELTSSENCQMDAVYCLDLKELVTRMRDVGGVEIKNRRYRLKVYSQCFVGSEATAWLQEKLQISLEDAIELGQRLIDEKWLHHVRDERSFDNGYFFYRFYLDE